MAFTKCNIYGSTAYLDDESNMSIQNHNDRWYIRKNGDEILFNAGFVNVNCAIDVASNFAYYKETLSQLGYEYQEGSSLFQRVDSDIVSTVYILEDEFIVEFEIEEYSDAHLSRYTKEKYRTDDFEELTETIVSYFDEYDINIFASIFLDSQTHPVFASVSSREITKNMVRVKSSNIWSYCIDIKKYGDKFGTVYVQFKGKDGGPEDLYRYYDVPIMVYRKWQGVSSSGHYFWTHIRNVYKYSKLTGDKKGKLPNAVN